ncbi:hypothetical protein Q0M94_25235 (plasmid) [Deinococcus radiomollis]|uniref:hypothetical protein n=1 Tax=Deinococcus radiomollis TaxID=468916 RepID=UPI0038928930
MSERTGLFELVKEMARDVRTAFGPAAARIDIRVKHATQDPERAVPDTYEIRNAEGKIIPPLYAFLRTLTHPLPVTVESEEAYLNAVNGNDQLIEKLNQELFRHRSGPDFSLRRYIEYRVFDERSGTWVSQNLPAEGPAGRQIRIPRTVQEVVKLREDLNNEQAERVLLEAQTLLEAHTLHHPKRTVTVDMLRDVADSLYPLPPETCPVYLVVLGYPEQPEEFEWRWTPDEIWELFDAHADVFRSADLEGRVSHLKYDVPLEIKNRGAATVNQHLNALLPLLMRSPEKRLAVYTHGNPARALVF